MKISTKGRYGARAMLDLALYYGKGPILLKDIAMRQEIPLRYLEQLIVPLKASGLVKSTRGARGGYVLSRLPSDIKLSEIIYVLEGSIVPVECVTQPKNCHRSENCVTRDIWTEMYLATQSILESFTLEELVKRYNKKQKASLQYHI
ncbi:MAG: Rrf2 family transcriptional regulator [Proteobacteria bacterium]|nr:Rrf2 family transcriptional regulator [Pseudomonadota bacterium]